MKERFRNPHPVDMIDYLKGFTFVVGGKDFEKENTDSRNKKEQKKTDPENAYKLDWSFLKKNSSRRL